MKNAELKTIKDELKEAGIIYSDYPCPFYWI